MKRKTPVLIASVALAALAACGGEPTPTPPPTREASVSATPTPTPSPTPTPTPALPDWAPDDPNWTSDQVTAARLVDRYMEVGDEMTRDPANADFDKLRPVLGHDLYMEVRASIEDQVVYDERLEGGRLTPVDRTIEAEATVDDRRQIVLRQCQVDAPDLKGYKGGVEVNIGTPRNLYEYVVQWVEADAGWRVVEQTKVSDSC